MKTSTNWLLAALLLLLASLTAYNMTLRAEYRAGTYKNTLRNYTALPLRDFTTVAVPAAGLLRVRVEAGPYAVLVGKTAAKYVHATRQGSRLTVTLSYPEKTEYLGPGDAVIIRCPRLDALMADASYTVAGQIKIGAFDGEWNRNELLIKGFSQDSLVLTQGRTAHVVLAGNHLGRLRATVGRVPGSTAELDLHSDNQVLASDLRIAGRSKLVADNLALPALRWQLGDSVQVELSGAALAGLRR